MIRPVETALGQHLGATSVEEVVHLQSLWSGYGAICRYTLKGARAETVIAKQVSPPHSGNHPRGWNTNLSHERKLKSYAVEEAWYRGYASRCDGTCRVPMCYASESDGSELLLVLEDLDAAGYPERKATVDRDAFFACVRWLAEFHATFMESAGEGLWDSGTYWHLETRSDELKILAEEDPRLHAFAEQIDQRLRSSPFQTLVHGDAKLANFCFSRSGLDVAAVDFQYVGRGCGMKDLAYFAGSCLEEETCARVEGEMLDFYFDCLARGLSRRGRSIDCDALEKDWRSLYTFAWADFHRFLKGWSPGHWKINGYSERVVREVIDELEGDFR